MSGCVSHFRPADHVANPCKRTMLYAVAVNRNSQSTFFLLISQPPSVNNRWQIGRRRSPLYSSHRQPSQPEVLGSSRLMTGGPIRNAGLRPVASAVLRNLPRGLAESRIGRVSGYTFDFDSGCCQFTHFIDYSEIGAPSGPGHPIGSENRLKSPLGRLRRRRRENVAPRLPIHRVPPTSQHRPARTRIKEMTAALVDQVHMKARHRSLPRRPARNGSSLPRPVLLLFPEGQGVRRDSTLSGAHDGA